MLISPNTLIGTSQIIAGQHKPDNQNFMRVLLGEVSRSLQRTSEIFSGNQSRTLFDNPLAGHLLGQVMAEKLTEHLVGSWPVPDNWRSQPLPDKVPAPDNPPFDPFFAPSPETTTQLARQGQKTNHFLPFLYHERL